MATAMNLPTGGDIQGTYDVTSDYVGGHDPDNQLVIIDDTVIQSQGSGVCLTLGGSEGVYTNFAPLTSPNPDSSLLIQNFKTIVLSYTRYETEDLQHHGAVEYLVYKNNGDMYFHHNETNSTGAALNAFNSVYLSSNKNIFFYENLCGAAGAAIYSQKDVVLEGNENIYFVNNTAKLSGGPCMLSKASLLEIMKMSFLPEIRLKMEHDRLYINNLILLIIISQPMPVSP